MPPATNIQANSDYISIWNKVLHSPEGISLTLATREEAIELRSRLYYARKATCRENRKIYPHGHLMHGNSPFDKYSIRLEEDGEGRWKLNISPTFGIEILEITELS